MITTGRTAVSELFMYLMLQHIGDRHIGDRPHERPFAQGFARPAHAAASFASLHPCVAKPMSSTARAGTCRTWKLWP